MGLLLEAYQSVGAVVLGSLDSELQRRYEAYLAHFRKVVGYQPSLALPTRYHEKMLWRKLFDHSPLIATFCDKLASRDFVKARLPSLELPDVIWVGDAISRIPEDALREQIVVKCNHGCDYNFFWQPGKSEKHLLESMTREWMASTYGQTNYEWGYTQVRRKIFAEKLVRGLSPVGVIDVNVRAACGEPIFTSVIIRNKSPHKALGYFDNDGNPIHFTNSPIKPTAHNTDSYQELPCNLDCKDIVKKCVDATRILSKDIDYARYDFLSDGERIYAGEITAYPASGLDRASEPGERGADVVVNESWDLTRSWFLNTPQRGTNKIYAHLLRQALS